MIVLKHVEFKIKRLDEVEKFLTHARETASGVDGVKFMNIYFPDGREEYIVAMDCVSEDRYLKWRDI